MKTYFITGSSGFIGSNLAKRILNEEKEKLQEGCQRTKKNKNIVLKVAFMKDWTANAHTP